MKNPIKNLVLLSGVALLSISNLSAVETDPVGYVTTTAGDASDTFIGVVLDDQVELVTDASGVAGAVVSVANTLVVDAYNATHYALFTSGTQAGQWYEITDTEVGSVTLDTDVGALGAVATDTFKIIKFWTLGSLLPATSEFATLAFSSNPFVPGSTVLLNNLSGTGINFSSAASYFYHDGTSPVLGFVAGWYQVGSLTPSDNVALSPETYFTVRNLSGGDVDVVVTGTVPTSAVGTTVITAAADQDNQLVNPYPSALTLDVSGLTSVVTSSANPFAPEGDTVLLFTNTGVGTNRSSVASYFHHDGTSPVLGFVTGWFQVGSLTASGTVEIPAGGAFWVRKVGGTPGSAEWEPATPYTL